MKNFLATCFATLCASSLLVAQNTPDDTYLVGEIAPMDRLETQLKKIGKRVGLDPMLIEMQISANYPDSVLDSSTPSLVVFQTQKDLMDGNAVVALGVVDADGAKESLGGPQASVEKGNYLIIGDDQAAVDAVAAWFDPSDMDMKGKDLTVRFALGQMMTGFGDHSKDVKAAIKMGLENAGMKKPGQAEALTKLYEGIVSSLEQVDTVSMGVVLGDDDLDMNFGMTADSQSLWARFFSAQPKLRGTLSALLPDESAFRELYSMDTGSLREPISKALASLNSAQIFPENVAKVLQSYVDALGKSLTGDMAYYMTNTDDGMFRVYIFGVKDKKLLTQAEAQVWDILSKGEAPFISDLVSVEMDKNARTVDGVSVDRYIVTPLMPEDFPADVPPAEPVYVEVAYLDDLAVEVMGPVYNPAMTDQAIKDARSKRGQVNTDFLEMFPADSSAVAYLDMGELVEGIQTVQGMPPEAVEFLKGVNLDGIGVKAFVTFDDDSADFEIEIPWELLEKVQKSLQPTAEEAQETAGVGDDCDCLL